MIEKIKNFLLKKMMIFSCFRVKKFWLGVFLFFTIFSLILPSLISAQFVAPGITGEEGEGRAWWDIPGHIYDALAGIGKTAAEGFLSIIVKALTIFTFVIPLMLSHLFFLFTSLLLGWVIGEHFISLAFTDNAFVNAGLSITKSFANMGFLIFLIVIALATALRIQEYKARKTLPILIIIGLLVNFSPVFCGVIIDASNITMFHFLQTTTITTIEKFTTMFTDFYNETLAAIIGAGWGDLTVAVGELFHAVAVLVFFLFGGYVFIIFSLLFTVRYVMLWILVIISPIAFVSYILPMTRRGRTLLNWRKWWTEFVQWCIIGIVAGFFLWLGFEMIRVMREAIAAGNPVFSTEEQSGGLGLLNPILPWFVPIILLFIAYKELKKTSAMFARGIISGAERVVKTAASAAVTAGMAAATAGAGAAAGAATKAAGAAAKTAKGASLATKVKAGALRAGAWTLRRGAGAMRTTSGAFGAKTEPFTWERRPPSEEEERRAPAAPAPAAPAAAAPPTPDTGEARMKRKTPDTGEARLKRRGIPDVGEEEARPEEEREAEAAGIVAPVAPRRVEEKPKTLRTRLKELVESRPEDYIKEIEPPELGAGKKEWAKWGLRQSFESIGKATAKAIVDAAKEGLKVGFEQTVKEVIKPVPFLGKAKAEKKKPKPRGRLKELMEEAGLEEEETEYEPEEE